MQVTDILTDLPAVPAETIPADGNLSVRLEELARRNGWLGRTAYLQGTHRYSYGEVYEQVRRTAGALRGLGVGRGDRVLLALPDSVPFVVTFLAVLRVGAVAIPVNTFFHADELRSSEEIAEATLVVADPSLRGEFHGRSVTPRELTESYDPAHPGAPERVSSDAPAFAVFTSGTTGAPRLCFHAHGDAQHFDRAIGSVLALRQGEVCYSVSRMYFAYGLGNSVLLPLQRGAVVVLSPQRADETNVPQLLDRHGVSVFYAQPSFYARLLARPQATDLLGRLRLALVAGESLPRPLEDRLRRVLGPRLLNICGTSEIGHAVLANGPDEIHPYSLGRVLPRTGCASSTTPTRPYRRARSDGCRSPDRGSAPAYGGAVCRRTGSARTSGSPPGTPRASTPRDWCGCSAGWTTSRSSPAPTSTPSRSRTSSRASPGSARPPSARCAAPTARPACGPTSSPSPGWTGTPRWRKPSGRPPRRSSPGTRCPRTWSSSTRCPATAQERFSAASCAERTGVARWHSMRRPLPSENAGLGAGRRGAHHGPVGLGVRGDPAHRRERAARPLALGRLLIGAVALLAVVAFRREGLPPRAAWPGIAGMGVFWFGLYMVALNWGEQHTDAGTAALLIGAGPLLVALLAGFLLHEGFPGPCSSASRWPSWAPRWRVPPAGAATRPSSVCCSAWQRLRVTRSA